MDAASNPGRAQQVDTNPERVALDAVPVPVAYVLTDGTVAIANRALAGWLGLPARSASGLPVDMVLGAQAGAWVREKIAQHSTGPVSRELALPNRDGPPRWVVLTLESHYVPGQESPGATVTIAERPQDGQATTTQDGVDELRAMVEAARPAIGLLDRDWSLVRWNAAFARIGIIAREDLERGLSLADPIRGLLKDRLGPSVDRDVLPDLSREPDERIGCTVQGPDGRRLQAELLRQPDGRIVIMLLDVTASSRLEEELQRSERMRSMGELTGGIAHDFNNLLSVIVGSLDVLEDQGLFGEQRALVKTAKRSALRGASLTSALLSFGLRGAGQPQFVSPNTVVEGIQNVLRRTLGGQVQFETRLLPELWTVHLDPGLLENALLNLAINARDAMKSGGTLTVSTENVRGEQGGVDSVVVSVRDTGEGMSPEVRARALEAFFTTKEDGRGTGLGLSMVQRFVRAAQGRIFIVSEEGRGTEMRMVFPRHDAPDVATPTTPAALERGQGHVLLLESDAQVRNTFRTMLLRLGYRVSDVDDASLAQDLIGKDASITVLLADANVPGGPSGVEVVQAAVKERPELAAFLISGRPIADGASGIPVLDKPCRLGILASALARASEQG